ncbi:MAG: ribose 5-phosphate isomerase B [Actinomycetales bacterium mxb001]|nr:MAG: ribose 5-phosphate isomerase B [Actinomycetales bacterium mxb001]
MKIAIGSDHAGFELKSALLAWLHQAGHEVIDVGTDSLDSCDYPVFGAAVGRAVASGSADLGVAVCGSGEGICMAANKIPGVRAGVIRTAEDAELTRRHNNANVACFGGRVTAVAEAQDALDVFIKTGFDGGRHQRRVDLLAELDGEGR